MHEWHVMWIGHSVHHSGEDYNMATGLRQGVVQPMMGWIFYIPLALLGLHPAPFRAHAQLNTLYMYWIHTDLVNRLPLGLEYIFNTPMAHRMHHRPPGNCNYAGMLIIWDRMFGTYVPEVVRQDVYGLHPQPNTFDPVKLNAAHLVEMSQLGDEMAKKANYKKTDGDGDVVGDGGSSGGGDGNGVGKGEAKGDDTISFSWWRLVFKKRANHRMVCDLRLLFKPIPPMRADVRGEKKRVKWDGAKTANWSPWLVALYVTFVGLLVAVGGVGLLLKSHSMHLADAFASVVVWCLASSAILRFADQEQNTASKAAIQSALLLPVFFGILVARPAELALATAVASGATSGVYNTSV
mmetsp:Transcript_34940/g.93472  ORF Transcript_34940/g.93472 Transcript_34940/m.93472 type:complete len:352 (-) Transcript_34940:11-1066(-)